MVWFNVLYIDYVVNYQYLKNSTDFRHLPCMPIINTFENFLSFFTSFTVWWFLKVSHQTGEDTIQTEEDTTLQDGVFSYKEWYVLCCNRKPTLSLQKKNIFLPSKLWWSYIWNNNQFVFQTDYNFNCMNSFNYDYIRKWNIYWTAFNYISLLFIK